MKTQKEIDDLKQCWIKDPCWDIETTPGFEEHNEELFVFRKSMEQSWALARIQRFSKKADSIGLPGNYTIAEYVMNLERRIEALEKRVRFLSDIT